jgi:hypothetical protein
MKPKYSSKMNKPRYEQPEFKGGPKRCPRLDGMMGRYVRNAEGEVVRLMASDPSDLHGIRTPADLAGQGR